MKIKVEKKIVNDEVVKTEELVFKLPKVIVDELKWEDGTLVEWERALDLDNEEGDVILTGRFKNKRTIVKKIGTDDLGQPTINGMKALNFRIEKLMPKSKWSKKTLEELEEEK